METRENVRDRRAGRRDASVKFNQAVPLVIMDERQALKCKLERAARGQLDTCAGLWFRATHTLPIFPQNKALCFGLLQYNVARAR